MSNRGQISEMLNKVSINTLILNVNFIICHRLLTSCPENDFGAVVGNRSRKMIEINKSSVLYSLSN